MAASLVATSALVAAALRLHAVVETPSSSSSDRGKELIEPTRWLRPARLVCAAAVSANFSTFARVLTPIKNYY